jgi:2-keto-4-pentenoate hydratase/2-oxohepta-3-ene-1,7-dioic acid hydratase in catechol pathway
MRFASYEFLGRASFGQIEEDEIIDLGPESGGWTSLRALLASPDGLPRAAAGAPRGARIPLAQVQLLPPVPDAGKIFCVGLNYDEHRVETGRPKSDHPTLFVRFPDSLVGHRGAIVRPLSSVEHDYEGELAVIIGRRARHLSEGEALSVVAGYSVFNDGSVRDWQRHTHQYTPGKNFLSSGAMGPFLVTADEVGDPSALSIETRLNGVSVQRAMTSEMIFPIPRLLAYITEFTELGPGDIIATGTPGGVGFKRTPPLFLKAGDQVEVEISRVGTLANRVVDERR